MKNTIATVTAAILMSTMVIGSIANAGPAFNGSGNRNSDIKGTWKTVQRSCSNGLPADDNFKLGRDSFIFEIQDSVLIAKLFVDGEYYEFNYRYALNGTAIELQKLFERAQPEYGYALLNTEGKLVFISAPHTGSGGTCSIGSVLTTVLEKQ